MKSEKDCNVVLFIDTEIEWPRSLKFSRTSITHRFLESFRCGSVFMFSCFSCSTVGRDPTLEIFTDCSKILNKINLYRCTLNEKGFRSLSERTQGLARYRVDHMIKNGLVVQSIC